MKNLGYYNGKYDEFEKMSIPMGDRVCFFGDGVYDATYSRNYKVFSLDEHIDRFYRSADLLEIEISQSKEELKSIIEELVLKMDSANNFVYWQATRGTGIRNHTYSKENKKANLWINIFAKEIVDVNKKINLITMEDTRFLHCNIKTLNLIPAVTASQRAIEQGCFEAVLHRNGRVTECAHSNVHIIKDSTFITAPTDNLILAGITRAHLLKQCKNLGIAFKEEPFTIQQLMESDEVIISSAGALCIAAKEVDGIPVGGKAPEILNKLQQAMLDEFIAQTN